jgi:hypothetical protein
MGGGGGSRKTVIKAPEPDKSFEKYLKYQMEQDRIAREQAESAKQEAAAKEASRRTAGQTGLTDFRSALESQLRSGLITYNDATSQLQDYAARYDLDPGLPSQMSTQLTDIYTSQILPGRRSTGVEAAYQELLGREATESEKATAMERFSQGYYSNIQDLKDSLTKSTEYQDKFNQSYLDNYYDTMFGKQTTDAQGKKTGQRTFKFSQEYLPSYMGDLSGKTNVKLPSFADQFVGTPAELDEQIQNIRETRKYLYSAGLTNLQGEIDKEVQQLKNEGGREIARITKEGDIYGQLVGAFSFS